MVANCRFPVTRFWFHSTMKLSKEFIHLSHVIPAKAGISLSRSVQIRLIGVIRVPLVPTAKTVFHFYLFTFHFLAASREKFSFAFLDNVAKFTNPGCRTSNKPSTFNSHSPLTIHYSLTQPHHQHIMRWNVGVQGRRCCSQILLAPHIENFVRR